MVFSSLEFLFWFIPVVLFIYFIVPQNGRNIVLLIASLFFYAYGEPLYVFLMVGSIAVNFMLARAIQGTDEKKYKKLFLILALILDFGILFFFKYLGFFISIINGIFNLDIKVIELALPLGISFYTFQIASYMIDVYRNKKNLYINDNLLCFATYVCMFPQLIAGPIVNYTEVYKDLRKRKPEIKEIEAGVELFILGMGFKVLLANKIGSLWNDVQTIGPYGINAATAWLGSWGYSMQLYLDFFGYSLMAIGLGKILGFKFPENFKDPYTAKSATDFWRRWHITLGRWFREYVYIPLGGNRCSKKRMVFNIFVVWALTGLWHGANWNFIIWGILYFVILVIEKFFTLKYLEKSKIISRLYMLTLIPVSWTIFNITDLKLLIVYLKRMFFIPVPGFEVIKGMTKFSTLLEQYWWLFLICAFFCTSIPMKLFNKYKDTIVVKAILLIVFWYSIYQLSQGASNPFLYFRF